MRLQMSRDEKSNSFVEHRGNEKVAGKGDWAMDTGHREKGVHLDTSHFGI
jgi:hypothetical protein